MLVSEDVRCACTRSQMASAVTGSRALVDRRRIRPVLGWVLPADGPLGEEPEPPDGAGPPDEDPAAVPPLAFDPPDVPELLELVEPVVPDEPPVPPEPAPEPVVLDEPPEALEVVVAVPEPPVLAPELEPVVVLGLLEPVDVLLDVAVPAFVPDVATGQ